MAGGNRKCVQLGTSNHINMFKHESREERAPLLELFLSGNSGFEVNCFDFSSTYDSALWC